MGTPTSNATCGGAGQVVTRLSIGTANGYSNYHGAYFSFKASDFHGLTLQENLTISKALGLNAYNQSTSSIAAVDSFNRREQYGCQSFDQRVICKHLHRVSASLLQGTERHRRPARRWLDDLSRSYGGYRSAAPMCHQQQRQNFGDEDGAVFTDSLCMFSVWQSCGRTTRNVHWRV
jgi:hypothetical protein